MVARIVTGVFGIALAVFVIQTGGWLFRGFALILSLVGWYEYAHAFYQKGVPVTFFTGIPALLFLWGCAWYGGAEMFLAAVTGIVLVALLEAVFLHGQLSFSDIAVSVTGMLYIGLPFAHLVLLRFYGEETVLASPWGDFSLGCAFLWIMFIGTWASDTFAYFVGSAIGRHKLCPRISPKKTVEGFIGSLVGTTAAVAGLAVFFGLPLRELAALGFLLAVMATLGDLVESALKRHTGIKDSGNIIPGHGGVLDRFDSVLFTAPVTYYFLLLMETQIHL